MVRTLSFPAVLLAAISLAGCVGAAPPASDPSPDASTDPVDGSADPAIIRVSGKALDYFTGLPLATATVNTQGMMPELTGLSEATGEYRLQPVPAGTVFYVTATREAYRPTRGLAVRVEGTSVMSDVWLVSNADARRQYTTVGLTPTAGQGVLFVDLKRNNGTALEGVPLTGITLVDVANAPVGKGPYFFGSAGDLVPTTMLSTSTAFGGRARTGFLDVPPGTYTLKVTYAQGGGGTATFEVPVVAVADGATLAETGGTGGDAPGMGARTFTTDVYPRLQKAALGGLGCANCHTAGGPAALLQFDLPVAEAHAAVMARPGVVTTATPATSLLLTKPLYETPPNHPNATFLDATDPDYLVLLQWITQGATL